MSASLLPNLRQLLGGELRRAAEEPGKVVLVGGAVVTPEWADSIGAGYSADAPGCVSAVRTAIAEGRARA